MNLKDRCQATSQPSSFLNVHFFSTYFIGESGEQQFSSYKSYLKKKKKGSIICFHMCKFIEIGTSHISGILNFSGDI